MANKVSARFGMSFQADGTSNSITFELKDDPIGASGIVFANRFNLATTLPSGFVLNTVSGPGGSVVASGSLSGNSFTVSAASPFAAGAWDVAVTFLF